MRTFQSGAVDRAAVDLDDEALLERAQGDLARVIGVTLGTYGLGDCVASGEAAVAKIYADLAGRESW